MLVHFNISIETGEGVNLPHPLAIGARASPHGGDGRGAERGLVLFIR